MKKKILIVYDYQDTNLTLKVLLTNNCLVDLFNNHAVALKNFRRRSYNPLTLDIRMSRLDGVKMYEQIRKIEEYFRIYFPTAAAQLYQGSLSHI